MITPLERFFKLLQPNKKAITHLFIFALVSGLISLSLPLGIQSIINLIQGGEVSASWIVLVVIVLLGYSFNGFLQIIQLRITENLQKDIFTRSAFEFTYRIPRIKMNALYDYYAPELMNRFFDTISIQKGVAKILIDFSTAGLQIIFGLILLSFYHSFFILFSIIVVAVVFIIGNYIFQRGLKSSVVESKYKYKVAFWLEEVARTNTTFRLACDSKLPLRKTDELVNSYLDAREKHFKILVRQYYIFVMFKVLVAAGFLFIGGMLVFNQQMNIGQFVAAEIIVLLLISSSEKLLLTLESMYDLLTSIEKIGEVTDMELEEDGGFISVNDPKDKGLEININHLSFYYPHSPEKNIDDLSLHINSNEKVCITGSNGSGKMTLLNLMTSFYEPQQGSISYNGLPIKNYDISHLRSLISECISEDRVFDGTLFENLTLNRDISYESILEVTNKVFLRDFVQSLPEGLNTSIVANGQKLSRSVQQKIILARNILKKPKLFLIEDFFSNIETPEKVKIVEYLKQPSNPWTLIILSKDTNIVNMFSKVIQLDKGRIVREES